MAANAAPPRTRRAQGMNCAFEDCLLLDAALAALPPDEAETHMQRCISSGLWDPNGGGGGEQEPSPTGESDEPPASDGGGHEGGGAISLAR